MSFLSYSFTGSWITQKYVWGDSAKKRWMFSLSFLGEVDRIETFSDRLCEQGYLALQPVLGFLPLLCPRVSNPNLIKMKSEKQHSHRKAKLWWSAWAACACCSTIEWTINSQRCFPAAVPKLTPCLALVLQCLVRAELAWLLFMGALSKRASCSVCAQWERNCHQVCWNCH